MDAPEEIRLLFKELLAFAEIVDVTPQAVDLQSAHIRTGIVSERWATNALHVALATVSECEAIVSWNFRHIVHLDKIGGYNRVNEQHGLPAIAIVSPNEVISYEDEG